MLRSRCSISFAGLLLLLFVGGLIHLAYFQVANPWTRLADKVSYEFLLGPTYQNRFYGGDASEYMFMAKSLLQEGRLLGIGYFITPELAREGYPFIAPNYMRMPLYPAFIAAVGWLIGGDPATAEIWLAPWVVIAQIFLHLASLCFVALALGYLVPGWLAAGLALFVMFDLTMLSMPYGMWAELLFVFYASGFTLAAVLFLRGRTTASLVGAGFAAGLCALTKPVGLVLLVPALALAMVAGGWSQRIRQGLLVSFVLMAVVTPYLVRNYVVWGDIRPTAQPGFNFLFYNLRAIAREDESIIQVIGPSIHDQETQAVREAAQAGIVSPQSFDPYRLGDDMTRRALAILDRGYWDDYLTVSLRNIADHLFEADPFFVYHLASYQWGDPRTHAAYGMAYRAHMAHRTILVMLVIAGCIAAIRWRAALMALPFLSAAAVLAVASAPINLSRTALPELVLLAPLVALGAELVRRGSQSLLRRIAA
jgi:hypothetical protein